MSHPLAIQCSQCLVDMTLSIVPKKPQQYVLVQALRQRELITSVTAFHSTVIATLLSVFFVCLSYRNSTRPTTGHLSSFKERRTTSTVANTSDATRARVVRGNVHVLHALRIRPTHKKQARAVGMAIKFPRDAISPCRDR